MSLNKARQVHVAAAALALVALAGSIATAYVTFGKWPSKSITYYVNPTNLDVTADAAEAATQTAAGAWTAQTNANFQFAYGGRVDDTSTGYDSRNVVIFRNASSGGALATTYYWYSGTTIVDADIIVWDGAYQFYTGSGTCSGGAYIEDVLTHEFGHALGLSHSDVADATMYPYYSYCSEDMRSLASDDIAGVESLYPPTGQTNTAPTTTISSPASGTSVQGGTSIAFSGSANDTQDGNLSASLAWTSSRDGQIGTGASFSGTLSVGSHVVTASVTDHGGLSGSSSVTVTVTAPPPPPNTAPSTSITSPGSGTSVTQGTAIAFTGSASDTQDGNLTPNLAWASSADGPIGAGGSFSRTLSLGTHIVTASVSDSGGMSSSSSVTVYVTAAAPPPPATPSLSARGYKVKGMQKADLSWSGFTATNIDIYRNGSRIKTTGNDGADTDAINRKGPGTYTYRACAAGTTTCSNDVQVAF
jgi:hypothetical protein